MGIIRQQSVKSTIITYIGFAVGAINLMFVMPNYFSNTQIGLLQVFVAFATQMVTVGSFGMAIVINKFLPYYQAHLDPKKRDLVTLVLTVGTAGMIILIGISILNNDLVIHLFSKNSPLFVKYFYLFPIFAMGYFYYYIFESFNNNYKFSSWSSFVRELFYKVFNLLATLFFAIGLLNFTGVMNMYTLMYWLGAILLIINLIRYKLFHIPFKISPLTIRLRKNIAQYSLSSWGISVLSVSFQFVDTFAIAGLIGLGPAAIYSVAKFTISTIVIPSTSLMPVSVPLISDAWRRNDLMKIEEIYKKTALVLVMIGGFCFFLIMASVNDILHILPDKFYGSQEIFNQAVLVILILGFARMLDFATSVNSYILQNSRKYYSADLTCSILSLILAIPLNYILIKNYGIVGASLAYLALSFFANTFKAIYLFIKEKIHPFSSHWWYLIGIFVFAILAGLLLNNIFRFSIFDNLVNSNITRIIRIFIRSVLLCGIFIPLVYWLNVSEDISGMIKIILDKIPFKKK
jgi:O-antigen/teichoic acid export membrane protein